MCSGARSSSANGAIAARAAPASSWSTSSSTVLSDCTIRGPSVIVSIIQDLLTCPYLRGDGTGVGGVVPIPGDAARREDVAEKCDLVGTQRDGRRGQILLDVLDAFGSRNRNDVQRLG